MPVHAVVFDAGETLVHPSPSFPGLFAAVLADAGHHRSPDDVIEASAAVFHRFGEAARANELWTISPERSARFWKGVYERMLDALSLPAVDGLRDRLYETFTDLRNYETFPDVEPAVTALTDAGFRLGIVSNFEAWLEDLLDHLGLRDRFPVRVISGIVGVEKPDPAIFAIAVERLELPPAQVAYVGDNPEFDVEAAHRAGLVPVLIDRRQRFPGHEGHRIADLREILDVVGAMP